MRETDSYTGMEAELSEAATPGTDEILRRIQNGESWSARYGFEDGPMMTVMEAGRIAIGGVYEEQDAATETGRQAENVSTLQSMISDEGLRSHNVWLDDQQRGEFDVATGHAYRLMERAAAVEEEYVSTGKLQGKETTYDQVTAKQAGIRDYARRTFGKDAVAQYYRINNARNVLTKGNVELWGAAAETAYGKLMSGSSLLEDGIDREVIVSPVVDPAASQEDFIDYLQQKRFIPDAALRSAAGARKIMLDIEPGQTVSVPLSNVVSASGFNSWAGRGNNGSGDKARNEKGGTKGSSIEAIMDYASRDTDIPPTESIDAFVQPDGTVLYSAPASNHRTAAAIARGQSELKVGGNITFYMLDRNFIEQQ